MIICSYTSRLDWGTLCSRQPSNTDTADWICWPSVEPDWTSSSRSDTSRGFWGRAAACPDPHTPRWHTCEAQTQFSSWTSPPGSETSGSGLTSTGSWRGWSSYKLWRWGTCTGPAMKSFFTHWGHDGVFKNKQRVEIVHLLWRSVLFYLQTLAVSSVLSFLRCSGGNRCGGKNLGAVQTRQKMKMRMKTQN